MDDYTPIPGFVDLREYKIPKKEFEKLWEIQRILKFVEDRKGYYMKFDPVMWQRAQNISAEYQMILNEYTQMRENK